MLSLKESHASTAASLNSGRSGLGNRPKVVLLRRQAGRAFGITSAAYDDLFIGNTDQPLPSGCSHLYISEKGFAEWRRTNGKQRQYQPKEHIYQSGDIPDCVYYVEDGYAICEDVNHRGREIAYGLYGPGDFIGADDLGKCLRREGRTNWATAIEKCTVTKIPMDVAMSAAHWPWLSLKILQFCDQNAERKKRLKDLSTDRSGNSVLNFMLELMSNYGRDKSGIRWAPRLSHCHIAAFVGTNRERVSKTLPLLFDRNLLRLDRAGSHRYFIAPDMNRLEKFIAKQTEEPSETAAPIPAVTAP